jgi:hypothetical protein
VLDVAIGGFDDLATWLAGHCQVFGAAGNTPTATATDKGNYEKEDSYASFKACEMSAIRSDGCSMPIDSRIVESRTPIFCRMSAGTPE